MYERFMKQWNGKYRLLTGLVLFLIGLILQFLSGKVLDMYAFYTMSAAMLCVVNVIIRKLAKTDVDFVLYLVLNMAVLIVGFVLTESEVITETIRYATWAICVIVDWVLNAILIPCDDILKRIVMGFVSALMNVILIAIVFMVPILMSVF